MFYNLKELIIKDFNLKEIKFYYKKKFNNKNRMKSYTNL